MGTYGGREGPAFIWHMGGPQATNIEKSFSSRQQESDTGAAVFDRRIGSQKCVTVGSGT